MPARNGSLVPHSSYHGLQQKMFLLLLVSKMPEDRCGGWKGQCQDRLIKNAPESILVRMWKHKIWALRVLVVPRSLMVWGSCRPSLLSRDPRGRTEDPNQPVAKMSSCMVMFSKNTFVGKMGIFSMSQRKHFRMKINDQPSRDWTIQIFHSFSSKNLCSPLLTLQVFPLLQQLCEKRSCKKQHFHGSY